MSVLNPIMAFLALSLVPIPEVPTHQEALLAHMGAVSGGNWLAWLISLDAALVLSGAVADFLRWGHWTGQADDTGSLFAPSFFSKPTGFRPLTASSSDFFCWESRSLPSPVESWVLWPESTPSPSWR